MADFEFQRSQQELHATIWFFWFYSILLAYAKSKVLRKASKKGLLKHSKVVANYMMTEHEKVPQDLNPQTMKGYTYIFQGEEAVASLLPTAPEYRFEFNKDKKIRKFLRNQVILKFRTIDSVWRRIESHSDLNMETTRIMKDVALSFSLFKLLKRRLCGYHIGEAGLAKTLDFVLHGLISEEGNYVRAFEVIETELTFLYDFLYTRFGMKFPQEKRFHIKYLIYKLSEIGYVGITIIIWNFISGALFSRHYHRSNLDQLVHGANVTHWVTIVLLSIALLPFISTSISIKEKRWLIGGALSVEAQPEAGRSWNKKFKSKVKKSWHWQRALGQYSLLVNFNYHPWNVPRLLSLGLVDATREGQKAGKKIMLTDELIERILSGFKERNGQLEDGQLALDRNQLGSQFSWACTLPTHIHKILVDVHAGPPTGDHHVAKTLSDYCAYLVAFVPDTLPDNGYDTQRIFDAVVAEARKSLAGCDTVSRRCAKLVTMVVTKDSNRTILALGGRLGRELRRVVSEARRWKVLADFWAEFILFLAPSSSAEIHAEKLAAGGEFMTHLWALLTHAGILDRPSTTDGAAAGGYSNGASAHDSLV